VPPGNALRPPAQPAHLMPQREQLRDAGRARVGANDEDDQQYPNEGVDIGEHHRSSVPIPFVSLARIGAPHTLARVNPDSTRGEATSRASHRYARLGMAGSWPSHRRGVGP
jgi:hypothetical protein